MYDYKEHVKDDCIDAIREWLDYHKDDAKGMSRDKLREELYDAFWIDDSVTGNASGSYTFSSYQAEQNLCGNWDLLGECLDEAMDEIDAALEEDEEPEEEEVEA